MELKLSQEFLTENDCYQAGRKIVPKGIMSTPPGVAQPDPQVFIRRWNKPGVEVCVHALRGPGMRSSRPCPGTGGAGTQLGKKRQRQQYHISFECCEPARAHLSERKDGGL